VAWRDWFVCRLLGALEALGAIESSRGLIATVLNRREAIGVVASKGGVPAKR
jgi:hypothetical protein